MVQFTNPSYLKIVKKCFQEFWDCSERDALSPPGGEDRKRQASRLTNAPQQQLRNGGKYFRRVSVAS